MKKSLKVLSCATLLGLATTSLVACSGDSEKVESALNAIIFDQTTVTEDFTVVKKVKGYDVAWSSSDTSVINIAPKDNSYDYAVVTRPDTVKTVTLTAKIKKAEKSFEVNVSPVDVYEIADSYKFEQDGKSVFESFQLDTKYDYNLSNSSTTNYATKTATMTWSSSNESLISISSSGYATVTPSSQKKTVELTCTFSYGGVTTNYTYNVIVFKELSLAEQLQNAYNSVGETVTLRGWVVAKEAYSPDYGNTSIYIVHESGIGGFYAYRVKCDEATYAAMTIGTGVKMTVTVTEYNGLIESTAGGSVEVDSTLAPVTDVSTLYQAIDKNVIVGEQEGLSNIKLRQSALVSLTGWKVSKIGQASLTATSTSQTVLTLEKNGVSVSVAINKNLTPLDGTDAATIIGYQTSLNVGDFVDVKGVLGYYKGSQVVCLDGNAVTKVSAESTVDVSNVKAALAAVKDSIPTTVTSTKTFDVLASTNNVEYSYAVEGNNITLANNKITVNATSETTTEKVIVTVKADGLEYTVTVNIVAQTLDADGMAQAELDDLKFDNTVEGVEAVQLAANGSTFTDVALTYALNTSATAASITSDGYLYIVPKENDETVTLTVTATSGTAVKTKDIQILVKGYSGQIKTVAEANALEDGQWIYVSGTITKYYEYKGAVSGVFIKDASGETEYQVYKLYDHKNQYAADAYPAIGSTVILYGKTASFNGTKQLASSKVVLLQESELTDTQKADKVLATEAAKFASSYSADATVTLAEGVTAAVKEGTTATTVVVSGSTVTITPADAKEDVVLVLSYTLNGQAYTKEVTLSTQKPVVPTDSILVVTPENFATATLTLDKVVENTSHPEEFTIKAGGSICGTVTGNLTTIVAYIYGAFDNMKMYAGTSAEGTLITATTESGENGVIYTYTMPADAKSFYFVNSSTYNVQVFSLSINGSGDLVVSDETKANKVLNDEAAKFEAKYPANATVTLSEGVTAAVKEGTTATTVVVNGSTVTITPTATKEDVVLVFTYTLNSQAYTKEVSFSTEQTNALEIVLKSTAEKSNNYEGNQIANTSVPSDVFESVVLSKNDAQNAPRLQNNGDIRLYPGATNGCSIEITIKSGYVIKSITLVRTGATDDTGTLTVTVGGTVVTGTDNKYDVNSTSVKLQNTTDTTKKNQVQFTQIVIEYEAVAE